MTTEEQVLSKEHQAIEHANGRRLASLNAMESAITLNVIELAIKQQEASIKDAVANAMDPETGKALYSNEAKRDVEFIKRAQDDPALLSLNEQVTKFKRLEREYTFSAQFHADMIRILCAFAPAAVEVE